QGRPGLLKRAASIIAVLVAVAACSICADAGAAIYWGGGGLIGRVNNDGSNRLDATRLGPGFIGSHEERPLHEVCGVAVDAAHIYWGDHERGTVGRANLDGSEANFAFIAGASQPCGVAVDGTHLFWANQGSSSIGRARLDGSEVDQEFIKIPKLSEAIGYIPRPCGVAVNGTHVFWSNYVEDFVGRASIDGAE